MKKNIMLIAIATLIIATANAAWNPWNPATNKPLQIVNNTNVQLEFRTWPSGQYLTLQPRESALETNAGDTELFSGWGVNDTGAGAVVWRPVFDGSQQEQGTLTNHTAYISKDITLGTAWDIVNIGNNDILTFSGTAAANATTMPLTATRHRGAGVLRGWDNDDASADVFCVNTNVEFSLQSDGDTGRCPANETQIVMVNGNTFVGNNINDYTGAMLIQGSYNACIYDGGCHKQGGAGLDATYITGFTKIPYSENTTSGNIVISLPNAN